LHMELDRETMTVEALRQQLSDVIEQQRLEQSKSEALERHVRTNKATLEELHATKTAEAELRERDNRLINTEKTLHTPIMDTDSVMEDLPRQTPSQHDSLSVDNSQKPATNLANDDYMAQIHALDVKVRQLKRENKELEGECESAKIDLEKALEMAFNASSRERAATAKKRKRIKDDGDDDSPRPLARRPQNNAITVVIDDD